MRLTSSISPSGIIVTTPAVDGGDRRVDRHVAVVERVAEQGAEHDHEPDQRVQQPVDRPLERRARVAEGTRLAGDAGGEAVVADRGHLVGAGALDDERPRANLLAARAAGGLGFTGEDRFVEPQIGGGSTVAVGDQLIAGREQHEVADHHLLDRDRADRRRRA